MLMPRTYDHGDKRFLVFAHHKTQERLRQFREWDNDGTSGSTLGTIMTEYELGLLEERLDP